MPNQNSVIKQNQITWTYKWGYWWACIERVRYRGRGVVNICDQYFGIFDTSSFRPRYVEGGIFNASCCLIILDNSWFCSMSSWVEKCTAQDAKFAGSSKWGLEMKRECYCLKICKFHGKWQRRLHRLWHLWDLRDLGHATGNACVLGWWVLICPVERM